MALPEITAEEVRELFIYDPVTGSFDWKAPVYRRTNPAGTIAVHGYRVVSIQKQPHYAHRLIWLYVHGHLPATQIDHINGIKTDNRLVNLREAGKRQNAWNGRKKGGCKNTLKGTSFHRHSGLWHARIKLNSGEVSLGYFTTAEEAHLAYMQAAMKHFGEFARLE